MAVTQQQMGIELNKELVRQAYDALNQGDMDRFGEFLSDDFREVAHFGMGRNKEDYLANFVNLRTMMPDVRFDIQEVIAEGDRIVVVENYSGTMTGELKGLEPNGRRMSVTAVDIYRTKDGKLTEVLSVLDTASVMEQLGLMD
jgi:steroid delta-isomerase-like uncharacterized protein